MEWKRRIDWEKLKTFHCVSMLASFTKAGEFLNISQSAISRQIKDLEYQVGTKLFIRDHRQLILTEEGEILQNSVEKMMSNVEMAYTLIQEESKEPQGVLKITTTNALATLWLAKFTPEFLKNYPKMRLTIIGNDQELDLAIRQADVAIRPYIESQPDLEQKLLTTFHMGLYASPLYLKEFGTPQKPEDLEHHRLLVFGDYSTHPYGNINWILKKGSSPDKERIPYMCINSSQGLMWSAEAGLGIAGLSQEYAGENKGLIRVLPHCETPTIDLYYVYPSHFKNSKRITAFGDYLAEKLNK